MALEFIIQGRNNSVRQLVRTSNAETNVANTWTVSSLLPGLNRRVLFTFSTLNFKGQSPGSAGGGAGYTGGCYAGTARGGNGGIGTAGAFVNTNITKASSMGSYTITLGPAGNSAMNTTNNIQAGAVGGTARGAPQAKGGTISSNLVFAGANTFIVPYGGAGGGGGSGGASGGGSSGGAGSPGQAGLSANSTFFGKSGNGGARGSPACYSGSFTVAGTAQTAIAFTPLSGATYIYPTNTAPPAHGITTWTSNNYGAGAEGQISTNIAGTGNSTPAANGSSGVFRLTVSGIRI